MTTKPKRKAPAAKPAAPKQQGCCTLEQAAAIDFEPWQYDPAFKIPTLEEVGNPHLIRCRIAYGMMHKAKPDMVELFSDAECRTTVLKTIGDLEESRKFFESAATLIEAARLRLIVVAGSCYAEATR
jgi:hypothetical protein